MSTSVRFTVIGEPLGKGSKQLRRNKSGQPIGMYETNAQRLAPWMSAVANAAHEQLDTHERFDGPCAVRVEFRFPMPQSRPKYVHSVGYCPKHVKPDIDKLVRSVLDALTASGLIADDSLVVELRASKYEHARGWTGADIAITRVPMPTSARTVP